jgi:DME family drug/metabolite transporter
MGTLMSLGLAVLGLGFIASGGDFSPTGTIWPSGIIIALLTSIAFIAMSHAAQSLGRTLQPLAATGIGLTFSGGLLLIVAWATSPVPMATVVAELSDPHLLGLSLYLGIFPTALAFLLYCKGIAMCSSALVALIASMIRPAVATGLSVWILSETPTVPETMGCTLLLASMLILMQSERSLARKRSTTAPANSSAD